MRKSSMFCLLVCLSATPLLAGVVFEVETTDHHSSEPAVVEVHAEGPNMKMQLPRGKDTRGGEMIFHGDEGEMVIVDHDKKNYMVMDRKTIESISAQLGQAMSQMEEALKNVPPGQRAMMEKMMKQRMPAAQTAETPPVEIKNTGVRATRNGYPCVKYEMWIGGNKSSEMWVTEWSNIEGGDEVVESFRQMSEFFSEFMESFSQAAGKMGGMMPQLGDNPMQHMAEMKGFPVESQQFDGDTVTGTSKLLSTKRQTLEAGVFAPPPGYKRQDVMKQMKGR